ncbi:MAG TPA: hypothetical protein VJ579_01995 [Candidatus Paceibacterota bacterium]|nr:hypothetical protein [Candidatus Paceibacterota bacterium]
MFTLLRRFFYSSALLGLLIGLPLTAQEHRLHAGVSLSWAIPSGAFGGSDGSRDSYYDYGRSRVPGFASTVGGSVFIGVPLAERVVIRPNASYFRFRGDEGDHFGYRATPMSLEMSSVGCDIQIFFSQSWRQSRGYVLLGVAYDSEKLAIGGRAYTDSAPDQYKVKRSAANIAFGRVSRMEGVGVFYEVGFHRTLSDDMPAGLEMPGSDFWKLGIGVTF